MDILSGIFAQPSVTSMAPYDSYIPSATLKLAFHVAKVKAGGSASELAGLLGDSALRQMREEVELKFTETNPSMYLPDQPVVLQVRVKNVPKLHLKVFKVNTRNFFKQNPSVAKVSRDINVDGLVPNLETTLEYTQPPMVQHRENLEMRQLNERGVYICELTGNGVSR
jgi:hypothetical protein